MVLRLASLAHLSSSKVHAGRSRCICLSRGSGKVGAGSA
jgi:hypothetical protein